jgi:hypothetical protein
VKDLAEKNSDLAMECRSGWHEKQEQLEEKDLQEFQEGDDPTPH